MNQILTGINDFMYTYILLILLVGAGVFFTVFTKGVQIRLLKDGLKSIMEKKTGNEGEKSVSSFQALMISTASESRNRKYCRNCNCNRSGRTGSGFLDVGYGSGRQCVCFY